MPMMAPSFAGGLDDLLAHLDAGFSETLLKLIDKSGKKDSEIYKKANVDRKLFSKIRNNPYYKPSKTTAIAFAIALELDLDETRDLIARAGYALSASSKFDVIIEYFIRQKKYDIFELNEDGAWNRYEEHHIERVYDNAELTDMLQQAGFTDIELRGELSDEPPKEKEERIFFLARKPEE